MNRKNAHNDVVACDSALSWIARLRGGGVTEQDTQAFALWLAEDSSHKSAMDRMLDMWDDLGSVQNLPFPASVTQPAANQRNWLAASVAMAACLVLAIFLWQQSPEPSLLEFNTVMGERHSYQLEDQSTLTLNTNSKVSVQYSGGLRHIDLIRGEAYFEVSKDADRPFEVDVGNARVTALGTAFNIYRSGDSDSTITVTEGVVRVTQLSVSGRRPVATEILYANQYLTTTEKGLQGAQDIEDARHTAWRDGKLIADAMPIPELVRQLERYWDTNILIGDSSIAALTFSGVFELDQPQSVLSALELSLDLQVVHLNDQTLQLLKASQ